MPRLGINNKAVTVALAVIVVASSGALYFKTKADDMASAAMREDTRPLPTVDVYAVSYEKLPLRFQVRGVLHGIQEVTVSAEVDGRVIARPINESQIIQKGDVLCRIDETFHELRLRSASAGLAKAQAALADAAETLRHIESFEPENRKPLEYAHATNARNQAQAAVDLAVAENEQAKERLARCTIRSPIAGIVAAVFYEEGELVRPSQPVAEIVNLRRMKLVVELTEMEVSHLGHQPRVTVTSSGAPNKEFSGVVAAKYPKANPLTRRVLVEILIDNPNLELRSNTFADCTIESELAEEKLLIPAKGVIHDYGQSYCYVARPSGDGSLVERRVIETHPVANLVKVVEVVHGLQDGDLVILSGHRELRPGQTVATHPVTLGEDKLVSTTRKDKD